MKGTGSVFDLTSVAVSCVSQEVEPCCGAVPLFLNRRGIQLRFKSLPMNVNVMHHLKYTLPHFGDTILCRK